MHEVTRILSAVGAGDARAAAQLLPLVYDELRRLATEKMAQESPGHTLQATALVHEVYLRLVNVEKTQHWDSRGHFFSAAAEAMRRILVEQARRKGRLKRGAGHVRRNLDDCDFAMPVRPDEVVAVDAALSELESVNEVAARLVKLRYFGGFTAREAADALGISLRKADQVWAYARAWLLAEMSECTSRQAALVP